MQMSLFMPANTGKMKELFSHVYEFPVEQVESKFSTILNVSYFKGRYMLSTRNAVYSFAEKYESFAEAFKQLKIEKRDIQKVLILGYGLGSITQILNQQYQKNCHYTAVDIDPVIIDLAKRYGYMPAQSKIEMFCADAYEFVKSDTEQYDLICVDVFIDDTVPENAESEVFLYNLSRLLKKDNGLLIYSRLNADDIQKAANNSFRRDTFKKVFSPVKEIETKGNLMLVYDSL
jgi:spermidine synthase